MEEGTMASSMHYLPRFLVPGAPISPNIIKAFKQGLADEPSDKLFRIKGLRCQKCGFLELYATD